MYIHTRVCALKPQQNFNLNDRENEAGKGMLGYERERGGERDKEGDRKNMRKVACKS